jgi:hypothetical protein
VPAATVLQVQVAAQQETTLLVAAEQLGVVVVEVTMD